MKSSFCRAIQVAILSAAVMPAALSANDSDSWRYGLSVYGWFPDMTGTTNFPLAPGEEFSVPIDDILSNLDFTFQGTLDVGKGNWGMIADVIYLDLGDDKTFSNSGSIGDFEIPVDVSGKVGVDVKSWIFTPAAYYRFVDESDKTFDLVFGLRYADIEQELGWNISGNIGELELPGRIGNAKVSASYWDAIIGMRGRFALGQEGKWYVPYYADMGTGDSDLTWQAMAGIGYSFNWGEIAALWRYLDYDLPDGKAMNDLDFSGPEFGAVFRWYMPGIFLISPIQEVLLRHC